MARELIPTQTPGQDGAEIDTVAGDDVDGHSIGGSGGVLLYVANGGAPVVNVTVQTAETRAGLDVEDLTVTVPVGETWVAGPFRAATFDRPSGGTDPGLVYVDLDDATSVTVGAIGR